jgi:hypothetical protein
VLGRVLIYRFRSRFYLRRLLEFVVYATWSSLSVITLCVREGYHVLHAVGGLREHETIRVDDRKYVEVVGIEPRAESGIVGLVTGHHLIGEVLDGHGGDPVLSQMANLSVLLEDTHHSRAWTVLCLNVKHES